MQIDRLRVSSWGALLLFVLSGGARAAQAPRRIPVAPPRAAQPVDAADEGPEQDDPRARWEAEDKLGKHDGVEVRWNELMEAQRERDRVGPSAQRGQPSAGPRSQSTGPVQGSAWINLGPSKADFEENGGRYIAEDSGRARNILPHPSNPNILYMATSGGGVWKTYDAGAGWEPLTDRLGTTSIGTLAMDPSNPEILFLGFGDPFDVATPGLVHSLNGGATWSAPVLLSGSYTVKSAPATKTATSVRDLKIDPLSSSHLLAATDVGLFQSNDGGGTWTKVVLNNAAGSEAFFSMWSIGWAGPHTWLASGQSFDLSAPAAGNPDVDNHVGLFRSSDDGVTWTSLVPKLPAADQTVDGRTTIAVAQGTTDAGVTSRIFLLAGNLDGSATQDLYRSEDGGQTWASLGFNATGRPTNPSIDQGDLDVLHAQAWYNQAIVVDPLNADVLYIGGNLAMVRSLNGGVTWGVVSDWLPVPQGLSLAYVHADFHTMSVGPDGALYVGSDGGIFKSVNAQAASPDAVAFSYTLNEGLVTHLIYSVACALDTWPAALQGFVIGGLQDNGTRMRTSANPTTFNQVLGGDGIGVSVSADFTANGPAVIMGSTAGHMYRSTDVGANWSRFESGVSGAIPFFVRYTRDTAATGKQTFLTFTDSTSSATAQVLRSAAGVPWADISGHLHWPGPGNPVTVGFQTPDSPPKQIGLHALTAHPGVAGLYGASSNRYTYVTTDGGLNWTVGLQPKPVPGAANPGVYDTTSIAFDPTDLTGHTIYLTTGAHVLDDGVTPVPDTFGHLYKSTDTGLTWTPLTGSGSDKLPNVPAEKVAVDPGDKSTLYVGTALGLYVSRDHGGTFQRFGTGLPLVEVTDFCIAPATGTMTVSTFGRGFWSLNVGAAGNPAGVRGKGDLNYDLQIDGFDLIDLVGAIGTTQANGGYRNEANLVGDVNAIDDADLSQLLTKFGGTP